MSADIADPEDDTADHTAWCAWCGQGFETERGAKIHAGRMHDETVIRLNEPTLECDVCGLLFANRTPLSNHKNNPRCGALLPDRLSEADLEAIVDQADTLLEVDREIRELSRKQTKKLLEKHDHLGEIKAANAKSPQQLIDELGVETGVSTPEGDNSWRKYKNVDGGAQ